MPKVKRQAGTFGVMFLQVDRGCTWGGRRDMVSVGMQQSGCVVDRINLQNDEHVVQLEEAFRRSFVRHMDSGDTHTTVGVTRGLDTRVATYTNALVQPGGLEFVGFNVVTTNTWWNSSSDRMTSAEGVGRQEMDSVLCEEGIPLQLLNAVYQVSPRADANLE